MALKFLNKKGWHTGSLRNIENVWKAEQKHDAEQKKLEELRKQIHEERERHEFRLLQEQAGLVPKQERLDFLYESGLAVGKSSNSDGFKALEALPGTSTASASDTKEAAVPGALFEDKPHSSNDAWRKLHSDPLLMIRQREQEALARIKNNPIQMSMIKQSVKQNKDAKDPNKKERKRKHHHSKGKHQKHSSSEEELDSKDFDGDRMHRRKAAPDKSLKYAKSSYVDDKPKKRENSKETDRRKHYKYSYDMNNDQYEKGSSKSEAYSSVRRNRDKSDREGHWEGHHYEDQSNPDIKIDRENKSTGEMRSYKSAASSPSRESLHKKRNVKLSEEERAARLREMQLDAEVHEEQRWKRLKKADEDDAREYMHSSMQGSKNFMDAAQKTIYGTGKGGSSTIEESIRRRVYYSQGKSDSSERNAFRR